jgi:phytoene synthase
MIRGKTATEHSNTNAEKRTVGDVIRNHSKTFHFATNMLPRAQREAIRALYAFCRYTDDLVDRQNACQSDLDAWRQQISLPSEEQTDPVLNSWATTRDRYHVNRQYEKELIDGVEMDLTIKSYASWEDLKLYCYRVASTVGLLSIPIIGLAQGATFQQAAPYASKLGIALQLTNILRDVGEDRSRGRVYLPTEDLDRFGLSENDIRNEIYDQRFINLMKFEIQRAHDLYREALPGIAYLAGSARLAVGAAALIYRAILDEIEKINYQVYLVRAYTSNWQKIIMLPGIFFQIMSIKIPDPK